MADSENVMEVKSCHNDYTDHPIDHSCKLSLLYVGGNGRIPMVYPTPLTVTLGQCQVKDMDINVVSLTDCIQYTQS